ncbi:MAG TPA: cytochrome c3 family protein [Kofleriaceae bacterium]|nr:cytochrome c3 family protein [Kofleriaceae bacterium]
MRAALLLGFVIACGGASRSPAPAASARRVASNVLRADYAGSEACADCHAELYQRWAASPMRNMTRDASKATIRAPFDGATLRVGPDTATMTMDGGARIVIVTTPTGRETFRVTKVVGGRYREDFVGVSEHGGPERVLPATYVFATQSWRYKGYSVMVKERPAMSTRAVWSQECIACHNTLPLATVLYDELYGPGLPGYQGKLSDRTLPERLVWPTRSHDDAALSRALADEIRFLGDTPPDGGLRTMLPAAASASEHLLDGTKLVELGVGCEACHNGSRSHAHDPAKLPAFETRSSLLGVSPPRGQDGTRAQWINQTCAKCHTVLFTRYPWTWEGGTRTKNLGGSTTNSGEGRDFKLGACATAMACTTCHDPHDTDVRDKLDALATPAGNRVCAQCHAQIAAKLTEHTHHQATSAGSACVQCHMPRKNMGLDYDLVRYHRIGSPTDRVRVEADRPLECALCHADKTVESLVSTMEQWWGKRFDRGALRMLYGDNLNVNVIRATLVRGKPHEQAVAIATLGHTGDRSIVPLVAPHLAHDYPLVRYYALRALERVTGTRIAIDVGAPAADVKLQVDAWLTAAAASR